jgi:hypothetical protein
MGGLFLMKNFLYLRVNAIIGILASLVIFALALSYAIRTREDMPYPMAVMVFVLLILFGIPVIHNLLITHIYLKYYPAKEIPKFSRVLNIICCILCVIELGWWLVNFYNSGPTIDFQSERAFTTMVFVIILLITILIQVTGSFRLIKKVRAAARHQMESSFV